MTFPTTSNPNTQIATDKSWQTVSSQQALELLQSDGKNGLDSQEIERRQNIFGANELKETGGRSNLTILWEQFTNIMSIVLIAVAVVSGVLDLQQQQFPQEAIALYGNCNFKWYPGLSARKSRRICFSCAQKIGFSSSYGNSRW